ATADFLNYVEEQGVSGNLQNAQQFTSNLIESGANYLNTHDANQISNDLGKFVGSQAPGIILTAGTGTALKLGGEAVGAGIDLLANGGRITQAAEAVATTGTVVEDTAQITSTTAKAAQAAQDLERAPNIVYRALNSADAEALQSGEGLTAKAPEGTWTAQEHVANAPDPARTVEEATTGGAKENSPWISTTKLLDVAKAYDSGNGIVAVDLNKVESLQVEVWRTAQRVNGEAGTAFQRSFWGQEVTVYKTIPRNAIIGFVPTE